MAPALERLTIRTDDVVGRTFELQFCDRRMAYLGRFLRRGKLVPNDRLLDQIEPHVTGCEHLTSEPLEYGFIDTSFELPSLPSLPGWR